MALVTALDHVVSSGGVSNKLTLPLFELTSGTSLTAELSLEIWNNYEQLILEILIHCNKLCPTDRIALSPDCVCNV